MKSKRSGKPAPGTFGAKERPVTFVALGPPTAPRSEVPLSGCVGFRAQLPDGQEITITDSGTGALMLKIGGLGDLVITFSRGSLLMRAAPGLS